MIEAAAGDAEEKFEKVVDIFFMYISWYISNWRMNKI